MGEPVQAVPAQAVPAQTATVAPAGALPIFGRIPQHHTCQFCANHGVTRVAFKSGFGSWLLCGGAVCVGCWMGCCLIPFCVEAAKDAAHHCPACNQVVGIKPIIG